mgnify:FL=1
MSATAACSVATPTALLARRVAAGGARRGRPRRARLEQLRQRQRHLPQPSLTEADQDVKEQRAAQRRRERPDEAGEPGGVDGRGARAAQALQLHEQLPRRRSLTPRPGGDGDGGRGHAVAHERPCERRPSGSARGGFERSLQRGRDIPARELPPNPAGNTLC